MNAAPAPLDATPAAAAKRHGSLGGVLRLLHQKGPLTRSQIAGELGLSRSGVRLLVGELAEYGLVVEQRGSSPGAAGRPSLVVALENSPAASLAIWITTDALIAGEVRLGGYLGKAERIERQPRRFGPEETVEDLAGLVEPILRDLASRHVPVVGTGVAFGGPVHAQDGSVFASPAMGWQGVPLASLVAARIAGDSPVHVGNDGDLGALAEHLFAGRPVRSLLYVDADARVGGGIVIDGRPLLPDRSSAAEVGHLVVSPDGHVCRCGNRGCWESEISAAALLRHAYREPRPSRSAAIDELVADAKGAQPDALDALRVHGRWVGIGLASLVNLFAPEKISLGGLLARLFPLESEVIQTEVRQRVLPALHAGLEISASRLGDRAPLIGAGTLALEPVLTDPSIILRTR